MYKNKGVIRLGLVTAIILLVAAVGGGAYYLGKGSSKKEVKVEENNLEVNQNQGLNKTGILSYKTPCEIANISKKSFSFNYPEGYTIKEIKPAEGNVPLGGVMQITIQHKDGSEPIMIGPGFDVCENTGIKLCKNIGDIYRLSTNNNSPEVESAYNQILSTVKSGTDCKDSSGNLIPIISTTKTVSTTNWKTYTNNNYDFSFSYPSEWVKIGEERQSVDIEGVVSNIEIQFKDSSTGSDLLVTYHISSGLSLYNYALEQFNSSSGWYKKDAEMITISGVDAVKASSLMTVTGRGTPINPPSKLTLVDFMDDNNIGGFNIQFKVPLTNYDKEIIKFNKLLTTFKFN